MIISDLSASLKDPPRELSWSCYTSLAVLLGLCTRNTLGCMFLVSSQRMGLKCGHFIPAMVIKLAALANPVQAD